MGVYIKDWSLADWKELLEWAKFGANNAMIGEFTEVEELSPHGRLIDADEPISLINTRGQRIEVTVAQIIENNRGIVKTVIPASKEE